MKKSNTLPELKIIIEKSLTQWMSRGTNIEMWELQDTPHREELENAIQAQIFIGWQNTLKGHIAQDWGDIQVKYYEEFHEGEMPPHISATWRSSELI